MAGPTPRLRPVARLAVLLAVLLASLVVSAGGPTVPPTSATEPAPWTGKVDLYRDGVFSTQASLLWCTAAGIQIIHNIVAGDEDHSSAAQRRYFEWMRARNRYDLPLSAGVDPAGWTAGLRHFVDDRYRLVASTSFDGALRLAVTRLRLTGLPVALTVSHGNHGWVLTGFAATADPAATKDFTITSVRVTGPLYGRQSRNGYDMPPDTKLTPAQLRRYFTPWRYDPLPMIWDGKYVSIQPVPASPTASPSPTPRASPSPSPVPSPSPTPTPSPRHSSTPTAAPSPSTVPSASPLVVTAVPQDAGAATSDRGTAVAWIALLAGALALATLVVSVGRRRLGRR